jgi:hypothetical protein
VGTSHKSINQHMSVAMQRLVDFISIVTLAADEINKPLHSNGHVLNDALVGGSHRYFQLKTAILPDHNNLMNPQQTEGPKMRLECCRALASCRVCMRNWICLMQTEGQASDTHVSVSFPMEQLLTAINEQCILFWNEQISFLVSWHTLQLMPVAKVFRHRVYCHISTPSCRGQQIQEENWTRSRKTTRGNERRKNKH